MEKIADNQNNSSENQEQTNDLLKLIKKKFPQQIQFNRVLKGNSLRTN